MNDECLICKKHFTQEGRCMDNRRNCLAFEEEPRGKKIQKKIEINIIQSATMVKYGERIELTNNGFDAFVEVIKIDYVDLDAYTLGLTVSMFEKDEPFLFQEDKSSRFKVIQGGKRE